VQVSFRLSELAAATGVPVPTIKFYLREGLLPAGERAAGGPARYGEAHVERLRLIGVLTELGGLRLKVVTSILAALDRPAAIPRILHALGPQLPDDADGDLRQAAADVDRFLDDELRWRVSPDAPGRRALAHALAALRRAEIAPDTTALRPYARAADWLASEVPSRRPASPPGPEETLLATVAFETALIALRRLAQEHHAARGAAR
jgi:DNA-binding transcriptional MerR regulator